MLDGQFPVNPETSARVSKSALFASLPPEWPEDLMPAIRQAVAVSGRKVVVLDDDPTGTQTVHDIPVWTEWSVESLRAEFANDFPAFFILTNSRSLPAAEAGQLNREIARNLADAATAAASAEPRQGASGVIPGEGRRDACPTTPTMISEEKSALSPEKGRSIPSGPEFSSSTADHRRLLRPYVVVSRGDSTLRGHFEAEIEGLSEVLGPFDGVLLVPFFETGGRITINDIHYLGEGDWLTPVSETQFARDVTFGYGRSNLREWVEEKTAGRIRADDVAAIPIHTIRHGGPEKVCDELMRLGGRRICVVNIASGRDLQVFVRGLLEAEAGGKRFLYRTAASFAAVRSGIAPRPLLTRADLGLDEPAASPANGGDALPASSPGRESQSASERSVTPKRVGEGSASAGGLVVVGSYVPISSEQLERLLAANRTVNVEVEVRAVLSEGSRAEEIERASRVVNDALQRNQDAVLYTSRQLVIGPDPVESLSICRRVSESLMEILGRVRARPRFIIAKGGITSSDVATRGLRVRRAMVLGQILPGIPLWRLGEESRWPGLIYVSFPGNLGGPDALLETVEKLAVNNGINKTTGAPCLA